MQFFLIFENAILTYHLQYFILFKLWDGWEFAASSGIKIIKICFKFAPSFWLFFKTRFYGNVYIILILSFELYDYPKKSVSVSVLIIDSWWGSKKRESKKCLCVSWKPLKSHLMNVRGYECGELNQRINLFPLEVPCIRSPADRSCNYVPLLLSLLAVFAFQVVLMSAVL